jgi:hypothetical protein
MVNELRTRYNRVPTVFRAFQAFEPFFRHFFWKELESMTQGDAPTQVPNVPPRG